MSRLSPSSRLAPQGSTVRGRAGGRWRAWLLVASVLLHLLVLAALLTVEPRPEDDTGSPPAYELMFQGQDSAPADAPGDQGRAAPQGTPDSPAPAPTAAPPPPPTAMEEVLPGPPTPTNSIPPVPDAPPMPPAPETPPTQETLLPPQPTPAPPTPLPTPARPPEVRLELPAPDLPPLAMPDPAAASALAPTPPTVVPAPRRVAPARPRPAAPQPPTTGTFANPMDLNFGSAPSRMAAPRMTAPRGSVASRSLDLSPGMGRAQPNRSEAFFDVRAAKLGADWEEALKTYWLRHRYYPRQAADDGEDGSVDLELTVDATGRVREAKITSRSGSTWLDMAAASTWRNAQLPPLPPELGDRYVFSITINYILIRR